MRCNNCGSNIDDGSVFCLVCGSRQDTAAQWQSPAQQEQPAWTQAPAYNQYPYQQPAYGSQTCPQCGSVMDPGARFCGVCGWSVTGAAPAVDPYPAAPKQKFTSPAGGKGMQTGIIAGAAALLVLVIVLIGAFTNWFGLTGPMMTVAKATQKTFEKGNFTVEFSADMDYESFEGIAYVDMDMKKKTVNVLMELEVDGEEGTLAIYDGYLILESDGYYQYMDISDQLDTFFETYEKTDSSELDWEDLLDDIDPYLYDEMEEYIDFEALNGCIKAYAKKLNNPSWLKKNAGYSTEKKSGVTNYILEPDLEVFLPASVVYLEDAVKDPDDYEDMLDAMEDIEDVADEVDIMVSFGVKGGKLVALEAEVEIDGEEVTIEATFSDIGKTKLDLDDLEDMLDEAKD